MIEFRDRLGWWVDRENAKIILLPIFNLLVLKPSVTLAHNPLVGGLRGPVKSSRAHHPFRYFSIIYVDFRAWDRGLLIHGSPLTMRLSAISF